MIELLMKYSTDLVKRLLAGLFVSALVGCSNIGSGKQLTDDTEPLQAAQVSAESETTAVTGVLTEEDALSNSDVPADSVTATIGVLGNDAIVANSEADAETDSEADSKEKNVDPWEAWNRPMSSFNYVLDKAILKPAAKGYKYIAPEVVENSVSRFFGNLGEISNMVNNLLQWKPRQAVNSAGRFLVNSTLGVGGLLEVASTFGLPKKDAEDFGQTLGDWGVGSGPYLVLPFLGPSTLRDAPARIVDWQLDPVNELNDDVAQAALNVTDLINTRAGFLDQEGIISGDTYLFVRDAYLQRREFLVNDGEVDEEEIDDFLEDF